MNPPAMQEKGVRMSSEMMKRFTILDCILFAQFLLFLVLWTLEEDVSLLKTINGIVFVVLFFVNLYRKRKRSSAC
jgi:di/tricarboxylate transporter